MSYWKKVIDKFLWDKNWHFHWTQEQNIHFLK